MLLAFVGKFQTDLVKAWVKELSRLRYETYKFLQHANDVKAEDTS